jgi:hypothetical protein
VGPVRPEDLDLDLNLLDLEPGDYEVPCCDGVAAGVACTCWSTVYDAVQEDIQEGPNELRATMCGDCACRPDSPERLADELGIETGAGSSSWWGMPRVERFYCHDGMRLRLGDTHDQTEAFEPAGTDGDYRPRIYNGRPYQASGEPAKLCAGWWRMFGSRRSP